MSRGLIGWKIGSRYSLFKGTLISRLSVVQDLQLPSHILEGGSFQGFAWILIPLLSWFADPVHHFSKDSLSRAQQLCHQLIARLFPTIWRLGSSTGLKHSLLVSVRRLLSQPTDIQSQIRHNYEKGPFNNPHSQLDISGKQFAKVWAGTRRAISRGVSLTNGHWSPVS